MIVVNARFLTQRVTGVQRFAVEISKTLRKLNKQIVFVTHHGILDQNLADELGALVIGTNKGTLWEQIDVRGYLILNNKPLLINFCNTGLLFYKKQVVTIHDMAYKVNPKWFSKRFYLWYNFLIPNIAKNSLRIFTVSNSSKNDITRYLKINPEKISVIYNSCYLNTNNNFEDFNGEKYLLSVSSLDSRKNLENLIGAFNKIDEKIKLVIVGLESDNFDFVLNKGLLNENIILKGYVTDNELGSLFNNAGVFLSVSLYEGFGLPALEAMAMRCPVIVSDIPAHREVCGSAALYVNPHDIDDIKNKINKLLCDNDLRKKLILSGEENIKKFDWFNSAQKILNYINEIS